MRNSPHGAWGMKGPEETKKIIEHGGFKCDIIGGLSNTKLLLRHMSGSGSEVSANGISPITPFAG